jgi:thioredoxin-like negative regulator of GroEL
MVIFLSSWDNNCNIVIPEIVKLRKSFATIKFYQVDIGKHAMLHSVFLIKELPTVVFVHKGEDFLTLDQAPSLQIIREGPEALQSASE